MKKIIIVAFAVLFALSFAGTSFCTDLIVGGTSTTIGNEDFEPSTNVTIAIASASTAYSAMAKHLSGDAGYTTTNSATGVTKITSGCTEGTAITTSAVSDANTEATTCQ